MNNKTIYTQLKELEEEFKSEERFIKSELDDLKELRSLKVDSEGFTEKGLYVETYIQNKEEMIHKAESRKEVLTEKILNLKSKIDSMLKYFNKGLSPKNKGMVLKLLEKRYNSPFKEEGLKGYSVPLWEIINFAIENNLRFYLQFKTLEKECLKVFDSDLNKWV